MKIDNASMLSESFYPVSINDSVEVRGLKLISFLDARRLISRSHAEIADSLLDTIASEFTSSSCFAFSSDGNIQKKPQTEDEERKDERTGMCMEEQIRANEIKKPEKSNSLTEQEFATAWRLIETYLKTRSSLDLKILVTYDMGVSKFRDCSPLELFGLNLDKLLNNTSDNCTIRN